MLLVWVLGEPGHSRLLGQLVHQLLLLIEQLEEREVRANQTKRIINKSGFRIRIFFADPDPGKNFDADPDPGGIRGRGLGVKGKMNFFLEFFSRFR